MRRIWLERARQGLRRAGVLVLGGALLLVGVALQGADLLDKSK